MDRFINVIYWHDVAIGFTEFGDAWKFDPKTTIWSLMAHGPFPSEAECQYCIHGVSMKKKCKACVIRAFESFTGIELRYSEEE